MTRRAADAGIERHGSVLMAAVWNWNILCQPYTPSTDEGAILYTSPSQTLTEWTDFENSHIPHSQTAADSAVYV